MEAQLFLIFFLIIHVEQICIWCFLKESMVSPFISTFQKSLFHSVISNQSLGRRFFSSFSNPLKKTGKMWLHQGREPDKKSDLSLIWSLLNNKYSSNFYFSQYLHCPSPPALLTAEYRKDLKAFLFSLSNPSGLNSTKMSILPEKMDDAIHCCSNYGPSFGTGPDLRIANNPNNNSGCSARLSNSYQLPATSWAESQYILHWGWNL